MKNGKPKPVTGVTIDRKDLGGDPVIVIEGLTGVIERDLTKYQNLLAQTTLELQAFEKARNYEVKKKQHYRSLIGGGKYNDEALENSIVQINVNIQHFENKIKSAREKLEFEKNIVDTLDNQLRENHKGLVLLAEHRKKEIDALNNKLARKTGKSN